MSKTRLFRIPLAIKNKQVLHKLKEGRNRRKFMYGALWRQTPGFPGETPILWISGCTARCFSISPSAPSNEEIDFVWDSLLSSLFSRNIKNVGFLQSFLRKTWNKKRHLCKTDILLKQIHENILRMTRTDEREIDKELFCNIIICNYNYTIIQLYNCNYM